MVLVEAGPRALSSFPEALSAYTAKELKKLKESRVTMAKQQKSQALQMQKLKKDQVQKAIQFKKSDVKK